MSANENVDPESLRVIQSERGAHVEGNGAWVATFADATEAARYITRCLTLGYWPVGMKVKCESV